MSRKFIVSICCLNVILGLLVLAWVFGIVPKPGGPQTHDALLPTSSNAEQEHSDDELWAMAEKAPSAPRAQRHLRLLSSDRGNFEKMEREIESIAGPSPPPFEQWPYFEAVLRTCGSRAASAEEIDVIALVAQQPEQALTLRAAAFRSFVENIARLETDDPGAAYALIDQLYEEDNSLSGTALRAEYFLREKGLGRDGDEDGEGLIRRAGNTLLDPAKPESNRLAAASVLSGMNAYPAVSALRSALGETGSARLKMGILRAIADSERTREDVAWLEDFRPETPEEERLVRSILEDSADDR